MSRLVYMTPNALKGEGRLIFHESPRVDPRFSEYGPLSACCVYGLGDEEWVPISLVLAERLGARPCGYPGTLVRNKAGRGPSAVVTP